MLLSTNMWIERTQVVTHLLEAGFLEVRGRQEREVSCNVGQGALIASCGGALMTLEASAVGEEGDVN